MRAENLTLSFGTNVVYDGAEFNIPARAKVGIVGVNGAGKTTLFKIMLGQIVPDAGFIDIGCANIGYLPQQIEIKNPDETVWDFIISARPIARLESELNDLYVALANSPDDENIQNKISQIQERLDYYDVYNAESAMLNIIENMQLGNLVDMRISDLSGGQKARLQIINMLADDPNLIILDEPTSHLDLPSIEELERALSNYHGAMIYISHDNYFRRKLGGEVVEIKPFSE